MDWQKGDALRPETFAHLFPEVNGVVHTLGTLIEDGRYKQALKNGDFLSVMQSVFQSGFSDGNPLKRQTGGEQNGGGYEVMNRDTGECHLNICRSFLFKSWLALRVCEAFIASSSAEAVKTNVPRPFVYISAEDIFRPVISERYITTKREAERRIEIMMQANPLYRGVYIRPSEYCFCLVISASDHFIKAWSITLITDRGRHLPQHFSTSRPWSTKMCLEVSPRRQALSDLSGLPSHRRGLFGATKLGHHRWSLLQMHLPRVPFTLTP